MEAAGGKINVDALTSKIEGKLSGEKSLSPQCSIFKIPAILLRHNKNAYEPNAFSIGPFHHGKENLKATETIKAKYLHDLISRLPSPNNNQNPAQKRTLWVKKFTEAISANWEEARQYYGGPIGMEEDQFVEVLVLDGCFIVELFRKEANDSLKEENDPETTETVFRNLISLEQCCLNYEPRITSYAVLLDNLINTHKDMEILCKNGAIISWLNLDKATKSFDNLYIDTYVKESFYRKLTLEVNKYCRRGWNRNRRSLVRDYIKPPWVLVSVIAASIALILSFLQTLFTIMNK